MPVAIGVFAAVIVTLFVRRYYEDVPRVGWMLITALAVLVGVKALSMTWTLSQSETIQEVLRSSMYLAFFLLVLAALSSERQVAPMMDIATLIVVAVAGYGFFQKMYPLEYPVSSLDGVRMDSTLGYSNTTAVVIGMGFALVLSRMGASSGLLFRGFSAVLLCGFATAGYLTVSRGGIIALFLGVVVMVLLTEGRLQMLFNLALAGVPCLWLLSEMQDLPGLLGAEVPDARRVSDGLIFRNQVLIAFAAAFVLQAIYSFFYKRYELAPLGKKTTGIGAGALAVIVLLSGALLLISRYGGPVETLSALMNAPASQNENTASRLASLSIGFRADYWAVALDYWRDHLLTGSGAGTFSFVWLELRNLDTGVQQVHNLYLEQGVETGIFAFLALLAFVVGLVFYVARATWTADGYRRRLLAGLLGAIVVYLLSSAIEWHWYIPPSTMFFFIIAAVAVKYASMEGLEFRGERTAVEPLDGETTEDLEDRLASDTSDTSDTRETRGAERGV
ncbi:MAG: O-antigen ligase family protein [Rubrobacter sp.]